MSLSAARDTQALVTTSPRDNFSFPVAASTVIYKGAQVALNSAGDLVPASSMAGLRVIGRARETVDNSTGNAGDLRCDVEEGIFRWDNSSTSITSAYRGMTCYAVDDATVHLTSNFGARPPAGVIVDVDSQGVWVLQGLGSNAGLTGSGGMGSIVFSLYDFREVTSGGDVGDTTANGGLLSSDTTPILRGDAAESQEISWAAGNADILAAHKTLPADFDGSQPVYVELLVYTDNTGGGGIDAATFTVETSWDGGALVSDTATDSTPAITLHKITGTIAAADIPDSPMALTLMLTPAAHAADPVQLVAARLTYSRKAA